MRKGFYGYVIFFDRYAIGVAETTAEVPLQVKPSALAKTR